MKPLSRTLAKHSLSTYYALLQAAIIGLISAFSALSLKQGISWLGGVRLQIAETFSPWVTLPLGGLALGFLAGWLIDRVSPPSAGGGIPQVKAALAQYPVPLTWRIGVVKALGTILVLGAGLTLGRRAPTVHIGAALAGELSRWFPTSPEHRRQMIAAGAAAGLAAGFNTPIAGVLFVVEELARDLSKLTLETSILASFTGAVVSRLLGSADLNLPPMMLLSSQQSNFSLEDIPFYLLIGALSGVFGGLMNRGVLFVVQWNRERNIPIYWRIGMTGLLSGSIVAFLPPFFRDNAGLRDFLIDGSAGWELTLIVFIVYFFLTMLAYGSGAPGGLFAPCLVLGAAVGYLVSTFKGIFFEFSIEHTYALAGMGAFFTAVARVPVTAIVIIFELTTDFNLVLPLMMVSVTAYLFSERISPGSIYQNLLELSGILIDEKGQNNQALSQITAREVMQSEVEILEDTMTLKMVKYKMSQSLHRGFPVLKEGQLVGILTQSDLAKYKGKEEDKTAKELMTAYPITISPQAPLADVLYLLDHYQLSRLPVTENKRLLGIITRTDIIRAEVNQLLGESQRTIHKPSLTVYQTRLPRQGKGTILVLISNPKTAISLLNIACSIAKGKNYQVDCLKIINSADFSQNLSIIKSRKLMNQLERFGRDREVTVNTEIRLSSDIFDSIMDIVRNNKPNLLIAGWHDNKLSQGVIFGTIVDQLIKQVHCDLMLIKLSHNFSRYPHSTLENPHWLIPISGGPNIQKALDLLPSLLAVYPHPELVAVELCQVHSPEQTTPDITVLEEATRLLESTVKSVIVPIPICARSISDAIIDLSEKPNCDVVLLGASQEGLLHHAIHGNIPKKIAHHVKSTVIVFRGAN